MAVGYEKANFKTNSNILAYPDHYVAKAITVTPSDPNVVEDGQNRWGKVFNVIKAGTVWPSNDENAEGIILNRLDVTNGDTSGALVIHGYVKKSALPAEPSEAAQKALPQIQFI